MLSVHLRPSIISIIRPLTRGHREEERKKEKMRREGHTSKIRFLSRLCKNDAILNPSLSSANAVPIQINANNKSGGSRR